LGRLLRTAFLADYFVKDAFRNELRRVLNRGEAVIDSALTNLYQAA
jgi:TnpA family transposase